MANTFPTKKHKFSVQKNTSPLKKDESDFRDTPQFQEMNVIYPLNNCNVSTAESTSVFKSALLEKNLTNRSTVNFTIF